MLLNYMEDREIIEQNILEEQKKKKKKIGEQMFFMQNDLYISSVQRVENITLCIQVLLPTENVIGIFNRFTMR